LSDPTIVVLTRLVNVEPTCEDACSTLMRLHAADGHRLQALRSYTQLRTALREDLDVEPAASTQHLYAEILAGKGEPAIAEGRTAISVRQRLPLSAGRQLELAEMRARRGRSRWSH